MNRNDPYLRLVGSADDEAEILARLVSGDRDAIGWLLDRFGREINSLVWRMLGADPEHDDLVHDVLCRIMERIGEVRDVKALRGWVFRVTVHSIYDTLRKRRIRRLFWAGEEAFEHLVVQGPDFEAREMLAETYRIISSLSPRHRLILSLKLIESLGVPQIAQITGLAERTVYRELRRAQDKFHRQVERNPRLREWLESKARRQP
jgi:RNA polymerase sigma-70 factor (ECF subfamily)